jgi:hypothetical protein
VTARDANVGHRRSLVLLDVSVDLEMIVDMVTKVAHPIGK